MKTPLLGLFTSLSLLCALSAGAAALELQAIAPDYPGLTVRESPILYFYVSHATTRPVRFTLHDPGNPSPVVDVLLTPPTHAGFWEIRLEDYHVVLEPEIEYRWFVSIGEDQDSPAELYGQDTVAGAVVERVDSRSVGYLDLPCDRESVLLASQEGLWIDAFACLSQLLEADPEDLSLLSLRDALLNIKRRVPADALPSRPLGSLRPQGYGSVVSRDAR